MISTVRDFFWPVHDRPTKAELQTLTRSERTDVKKIRRTPWGSELDLALEEARRLVSEEEERRKTSESKASNLLLVTAALIPLLTYLEATIWDSKLTTAPTWLTLPILATAVAYLGCAAWWAFRTVDVGNYLRIYPTDLAKIWQAKRLIKKTLIVETLVAVRRNQETVNEKVSYSKMTHAFLLRAVLSFSALLLIRLGYAFFVIVKH